MACEFGKRIRGEVVWCEIEGEHPQNGDGVDVHQATHKGSLRTWTSGVTAFGCGRQPRSER